MGNTCASVAPDGEAHSSHMTRRVDGAQGSADTDKRVNQSHMRHAVVKSEHEEAGLSGNSDSVNAQMEAASAEKRVCVSVCGGPTRVCARLRRISSSNYRPKIPVTKVCR